MGIASYPRWLSPRVQPGLRFWGHMRERDVWVPGFPKGRRISLMPLGQGSLGYQAREGRGQGPARSFPEADSSILSSCFGSLHNKGGTFTLFGLVYFETFLDEGLGLKELGINLDAFPKESGWFLPVIPVTLEKPCRLFRFITMSLPTCSMSLAGHFHCNLGIFYPHKNVNFLRVDLRLSCLCLE